MTLNRRYCLAMHLTLGLGFAVGCGILPIDNLPGGNGGTDTTNPDGSNPDGSNTDTTPQVADDALADFSLADLNPTSATFEQDVSPRDYLGEVSAWYFGHST